MQNRTTSFLSCLDYTGGRNQVVAFEAMDPVVELQKRAFESLDEVCSSLSDDEWAKPTECPGWDVKDNLSHVIGTELTVLGRQAPEHDPGERAYVKNPIGAANEIQVDYRRPWPPSKVLDEYREVFEERMRGLEALSEEDLEGESWTPVGQGTVRDLIAVRVMDIWVHEQDIRRALGKPGNLEGPVAEHAFRRHSLAMPFVVGKKVGAPDGTTVVFDVTGFGTIPVVVDGRAKQMDSVPDSPTATLSMDLETFNRLCCGRGDSADLREAVKVEGDPDLGGRIIDQMSFMI